MKERILTFLKSRGGFTSGQKIADSLGITRNAVNKQINSLKAQGYNIESRRSLGYRLVDANNIIDHASVEKARAGGLFGRRVLHYKTIDSTNNEAYRLAESGAESGSVIIADTQSAGKGRMGRSWESSAPTNLYFSLILRPVTPPSEAPKLTVMSALAVANAIEVTTGLTPKIKWPNDIYIDGKKVCGILTEMKSEADMIEFMALGIGVNVNSEIGDFTPELEGKVTTLKHVAGKALRRQELFEKIIQNLEKWYIIITHGDFSRIREEWSRRCYLTGKVITVESGQETITGVAKGIDENGFLLVQTGRERRRVFSGTIREVK